MSIKLLIACWLLGYLSALFTLIGVSLGGFLVYRTKRESHESIMGGPAKGDIGTARGSYFQDDLEDDEEVPLGEDASKVNKQTERFLKQFGDRIN